MNFKNLAWNSIKQTEIFENLITIGLIQSMIIIVSS